MPVKNIPTQHGALTLMTVMILLMVAMILFNSSVRLQLIESGLLKNQESYHNLRQIADAGNLETLSTVRALGQTIANPLCNTIDEVAYCSELSFGESHAVQHIQVTTQATRDPDANATVSRTAVWLPWIMQTTPSAALIFPGNLNQNIDLQLSGNPHGGGPNIETALWSSGSIQLSPNSKHLVLAEGTGLNQSLPLTSVVVDQALPQSAGGDFPDDIFQDVFGIPASQYAVIAETAIRLTPAQCRELNHNSSGLFWIEGHGVCELDHVGDKNADTIQHAVILVLNDVALSLGSSSKVYGIVMLFAPDDHMALTTAHFEAGSQLWGSLISNQTLDQRLQGLLTIIWQDFSSYFNQTSAQPLGAMLPLPGRWIDQ